MYIIGGSSSLTDYGSTTVKKLNLQESSVEDVVAMNEARYNAFGAAMNGKIYVAGGLQKKDGNLRALNTCEVYDPSTDEWQLIPNLNVPRYSANMVCFNGVLYVIGGLSYKQSRELSVEMYDSKSNKWKKKSSIPISCENDTEKKKMYHYKACFATIQRDTLKKPINF